MAKTEVKRPVKRSNVTEDPTDRLPSAPPKDVQTVQVTVVSVREWFDNWCLHREGVPYVGEFRVDAKGEPILPPHVVLEEDYTPPELDLPATNLAKGRRAPIRGGATGMPSL